MQTEINVHETGTLSKEQLLLFLEKGELAAQYIRINSDIYIKVYIKLKEEDNDAV